MRFLALPTSLLLSITLQTQISVAQFKNDFTSYPEGSQSCLNNAADQSKCTGNNGQQMNSCLCRNQGNFVYNVATCVAKASPSDLDAVYDTLSNNCAGTGVTIAVSKDAFDSQAEAATESSSTSTPSATSSSTTSATTSETAEPTSATGLTPTGTRIALGAGIGFGVAVLGILVWFVWLYSRRRRAQSTPPPADKTPNDVELSNNQVNPSYVSSMASPAGEYAHQNTQFGAVELGQSSREWKELPGNYYDNGKGDDFNYKRSSGVPLLAAELGAEDAHRANSNSPIPTQPVELPVELPADVVYHEAVTPVTPGGAPSPIPTPSPFSRTSHSFRRGG
ncbi:hypothetical protein F4804DRAFT_301498 [Jackrogersella minutella]|nr:hypothetical protein F4804DRAFT_301498 [Jackrogersella minutella]